MADQLASFISDWELGDDSQIVEVMILSMTNLGLVDKVNSSINEQKNLNADRKVTSFETQKLIWDF